MSKKLVISEKIRIFAPMETKNEQKEEKKYPTERKLFEGLRAGKKDAQSQFYNDYKRLFFHILRNVFDDLSLNDDFEEDLVNDFIVYVTEDNARRISNFNGQKEGCFVSYLSLSARRFFIKQKEKYKNFNLVPFKEDITQETEDTGILSDSEDDSAPISSGQTCDDGMVESFNFEMAWKYIQQIIDEMPNKRYAHAIRTYYICECDDKKTAMELNMKRSNWDVLKGRAFKQLKITHNKNRKLWQNTISQMS